MNEPSTPDGHPDKPDLVDFNCSGIWDSAYFHAGYQSYRPSPGKKNRRRNELQDLRRQVISLQSHSVWLEETLKKTLKAITQLQEDFRSLRPSTSSGPPPKLTRSRNSPSLGILESELHDAGN
ncbi:MAG: hypothetical protein KC643_13745 [Nitrospira sp.]|nr:hypothetical protein [Nitrospira sp.]